MDLTRLHLHPQPGAIDSSSHDHPNHQYSREVTECNHPRSDQRRWHQQTRACAHTRHGHCLLLDGERSNEVQMSEHARDWRTAALLDFGGVMGAVAILKCLHNLYRKRRGSCSTLRSLDQTVWHLIGGEEK